ncbi:hypothetical protein [Parapedobacter soli]|uniref:hypothetical protein n=1 Tax=Parapedobacter soli TaxID=416955 RepID=UPI0021C597EA|nr:hypothetical protein [Parapedobacter soli]
MASLIKSVDNFITNQVKEVRIAFNLTQKELSREINDNPESNFVSSVENNETTTCYSDHHLNVFATFFNALASTMTDNELEERGLKRNYSLIDFYPDCPIEEKLVEKDIKFIPNRLKASGALFILIESKDDFLIDWHNSMEFADYCNTKFNKNWTRDIFNGTLAYAHKKGVLDRESDDSPRYKLRKE